MYKNNTLRLKLEYFIESNYCENNTTMMRLVVEKFGNSDFVIVEAENIMDKIKNIGASAYKKVKDFGSNFSSEFKNSYGNTRNDAGVKKIQDSVKLIANVASKFSKKFKIDPVSAAMIIAAGVTGGYAAIPVAIVAYLLRKEINNLVSNPNLWKKVVGYTPDEMDEAYRNWMAGSNAPQLAHESKLSFKRFVLLKDQKINEYDMDDMYAYAGKFNKDVKEKGFMGATGGAIGKFMGTGVGFLGNAAQAVAPGIKNAYKYIKGNPVKTGILIIGVIIGSLISHYATEGLNKAIDIIREPHQHYNKIVEELRKNGVSEKEIKSIADAMYDADNAMAKAGEIDKSLNSIQGKVDKLGVLSKAEFDRRAGSVPTSDVDQFMKDVATQNDIDNFLKTIPKKPPASMPKDSSVDDFLSSIVKK